MGGGTIHIIEDEKDVRDVLAEKATIFSFQDMLFSNGNKARQAIAQPGNALIIIDHGLPGVDGKKLVNKVSKLLGIDDLKRKIVKLLDNANCTLQGEGRSDR
jgi:DNA-binding response OmpR family regulator